MKNEKLLEMKKKTYCDFEFEYKGWMRVLLNNHSVTGEINENVSFYHSILDGYDMYLRACKQRVKLILQ